MRKLLKILCPSLLGIAKLQRVRNTAVRLIVGARRFVHMTPILRDLHWLPIPARLEFKILLITFKFNFRVEV